jgi:hypothetical protein
MPARATVQRCGRRVLDRVYGAEGGLSIRGRSAEASVTSTLDLEITYWHGSDSGYLMFAPPR